MARKDLLKGLMDAATSDTPAPSGTAKDAPKDARVNPAKPRYATGAIGAVSQSIANLKSKAVVELDPHSITAGGLVDRVSYEDGPHYELVESLRTYGQQVPILVRPHPTKDDKYQIVYGRRRLLAMQEIGEPVKALIRELDDRELVMAQGQENTQRRDLSFIEKAHFAFQMERDGYDRKIICDALAIDKTQVSKMVSILERIDYSVIQAIGAADGVGRDRWLELAQKVEDLDMPAETIIDVIILSGPDAPTDTRFDYACKAVGLGPNGLGAPSRAERARQAVIKTADDKDEIAKLKRTPKAVTLTFNRKISGGFEDWLAAELPALHFRWEHELLETLGQPQSDTDTKETN